MLSLAGMNPEAGKAFAQVDGVVAQELHECTARLREAAPIVGSHAEAGGVAQITDRTVRGAGADDRLERGLRRVVAYDNFDIGIGLGERTVEAGCEKPRVVGR